MRADLTLLVVGTLALAHPVFGQSGGGALPAGPDAGATHGRRSAAAEVMGDVPVLRREVFRYPGAGRRDPFEPLSAGDELGPRFEDLRLSGILYGPGVGSVAVLLDRATQERYRVRVGDRLGDVRVVEIEPSEVHVLVSTFGVSRREVLELEDDQEAEGSGR